jgi:succinyl-CoA synthetase alpha subunit
VHKSFVRFRIIENEYRDSMVLMYVSAHLKKAAGVEQALAIMGTENNKKLLKTIGLWGPEAETAGPNDLIIAVKAANEGIFESALDQIEMILSNRIESKSKGEAIYYTIESGARALPKASIAVISVPGPFAAREARRALELGMNVFIFSDNVDVEEEVKLKRLAEKRGLLVMGPDCGTAIVNGTCLGFANAVQSGSIGIVGASGTGIQEICVLLDRAGLGISHAIGTGGRDLSAAVGAITTLRAIDMLEADPKTDQLIILSKLPEPQVAEAVLARISAGSKQTVVSFLTPDLPRGKNSVNTLEEAAMAAAAFAGKKIPLDSGEDESIEKEKALLAPGQRFIRGLYCGGSLCEEAMLVWQNMPGDVWSNVPLRADLKLVDPSKSYGHSAIDLGDDFFTASRPHPMIDPAGRCERLLSEAMDPETGVVVLDVVLGYGVHPNMAGELASAITEARTRSKKEGRHLAVVAYVCGTKADRQGLNDQEEKLRTAGAILAASNAGAARMAARIVGDGGRK